MQPINDDYSLGQAIRAMEFQREAEMHDLTSHFHHTVESLNPKNIIRDKIADIAGGSTLKNKIIKYGVGLLGGFIARKAIVGKSHNFFKRMLGNAAQAAVSGMILKAPLTPKTRHESDSLMD
ncbi:hypothetical protein HYN48_10240 [Flavobacterium magnum]|uniref:Uncharacterized protein n=1 Tax=Flavobacterium magnum TaxID=2162713 RepID=A0A2S0RGT0_9FLAO|nr:hypothetical protein [Flavobacterium magnum]AWA30438.1 hypothetical protein HYN48_10240 [Flavobacterium magnum]